VYTCFLDLAKAYDSVHREMLWKVLRKIGIPEDLVELIAEWHNGMQATVLVDGAYTDKFDITNGVRQGDVMAPILFNIYFSMVIKVLTQRIEVHKKDQEIEFIGIPIASRFDTHCWEQKKTMKAKVELNGVKGCWVKAVNAAGEKVTDFREVKTSTTDMWSALFADDAALMSLSHDSLQFMVTGFSDVCKAFGLQVSIKKTEVLHQMPLKTKEKIQEEKERMKREKPKSDIEIDGVRLNEVYQFKYLGSRLNKPGTPDDEIERRENIAKWKLRGLHKVFRHKQWLSKETRIRIYKTVVVSAALWDCNNWNLSNESPLLKRLRSFNHNALLRISRRTRKARLCYEETVKDSDTIAIKYQVQMRRLRSIGRVERMKDSQLPKLILYGDIIKQTNTRKTNHRTYTAQLKEDLATFDINEDTWRAEAMNKNAWDLRLSMKRQELNDAWIAQGAKEHVFKTNETKRTTKNKP